MSALVRTSRCPLGRFLRPISRSRAFRAPSSRPRSGRRHDRRRHCRRCWPRPQREDLVRKTRRAGAFLRAFRRIWPSARSACTPCFAHCRGRCTCSRSPRVPFCRCRCGPGARGARAVRVGRRVTLRGHAQALVLRVPNTLLMETYSTVLQLLRPVIPALRKEEKDLDEVAAMACSDDAGGNGEWHLCRGPCGRRYGRHGPDWSLLDTMTWRRVLRRPRRGA